MPYDPEIPLLGRYSEKMKGIWKSSHTPMFTAALFTIAEMWKRPKHPWTDEWIEVAHTYNGGSLSHKNNELMPPAATWGATVSQRKTNITVPLMRGLYKQMAQRNLLTKQSHRCREKAWLPEGKGDGEGQIRSLGLTNTHCMCIKQINNKDILYNTWNYIYLKTICNGKECENVCASIHI